MVKQAEYSDAKKVAELLDICQNNNYFVKHDFNLKSIQKDQIRSYIFEFRILFFFEEDNIMGLKLPATDERQDMIEILVVNKENINFFRAVIKLLCTLCEDFEWKVLRITIIDIQRNKELIRILKDTNFKKISVFSTDSSKISKEIYEFEMRGENL